ncbi:MAG: 1-acyl-sn-glycerol-3-phosphate acyltransferase [Chitinophagaceae bacterium]|nr:1-acyl-sn-glycerol-3-phosphate acyltransferase [Oligoflexus sp.]
MRFCLAYRSPDRRLVRRRLRDLIDTHPRRPLLICANHMTMIDSLLLTWLLFDLRTLMQRFSYFPWNVPELANFGKNFFLRGMCYIAKCVYLERQGSVASKRLVWEKISYLNRLGESLCVFPEGGRSRTGNLNRDAAMYGVGQLVQSNPRTLVLAVYLRGRAQKTYGFWPRWGDRIWVDWKQVDVTIAEGRKAQRDITMQIFDQLEVLERGYHAAWQ